MRHLFSFALLALASCVHPAFSAEGDLRATPGSARPTPITAVAVPSGAAIRFNFNGNSEVYSDSSLTTPQTTDTGAVCGWGDLENANDASQTTGTACPELAVGALGGQDCLYFDGDDQFNLANDVFSGLTSASMLIVFKIDDFPPPTTSHRGWLDFGSAGQASHMTWSDSKHYSDDFSTVRRTSNCGAGSGCPQNLPDVSAAYNYLYVRSSDSNYTTTINGSGTTLFQTATNTFGASTSFVRIGQSGNATYFLKGHICALIVWEDDTDQQTDVDTYVNSVWGL